MANTLNQQGVLRVVNNSDLQASQDAADEARAEASRIAQPEMPGLVSYVLDQFSLMRRHRDNAASGWSNRLLTAMRMFNGQYDPSQLEQIRKFGGSDVYARIVAVKCRGASSLLRDVYLGTERSWSLGPDQDPSIPPEIDAAVRQLVSSELQGAAQAGMPPDPRAIRDRVTQLLTAARDAAKVNAAKQSDIAEDRMSEILKEGQFDKAMAEFLVDLPLFPYACIKGPVVRIVNDVQWVGGRAQQTQRPRMFWNRVSPFDIFWTPGVSDIEDADMVERSRLTRADLNDLLDLPGYNVAAIREILDLYGRGGLVDNWDTTDSERAVHESREDPRLNRSGLINCLEFQGNVQGRMLLDAGLPEGVITDPLRDYFVQAWIIGTHVIKVQLAPSPRKRHQYYVTSFEKVPGTTVGNALPDILSDIQNVCNAVLRGLVNNLSMSSGPQVVVNDDRLADDEDGEDLYPWKRWHVTSDPLGNNNQPPIEFFQPQSNAQDLLSTYNQFVNLADELSAVPRYMTGAQAGAAGRTSSGLAMLMGNASKILQTVAANIDRDIMSGVLNGLYDMIMMTDDTGLLTGSEEINVLGVSVVMQKETQRQRQLEFLQATANPIDMQIIGPKGRAAVLRPVANTLGLPGEEIVPSDDKLDAMQQAAAAAAQAQGQPGHSLGGDQAQQAQGQGAGGDRSTASGDMGPRTNLNQQAPQGPHTNRRLVAGH